MINLLEGLHPVYLTLTLFAVLFFHRKKFGYIFTGRSSDSRINLLSAPSHQAEARQWHNADFVTGHSGGTASDFNGIPY